MIFLKKDFIVSSFLIQLNFTGTLQTKTRDSLVYSASYLSRSVVPT